MKERDNDKHYFLLDKKQAGCRRNDDDNEVGTHKVDIVRLFIGKLRCKFPGSGRWMILFYLKIGS